MKIAITVVLQLIFFMLTTSVAAHAPSTVGTFYNPQEIQSLATRYTIVSEAGEYRAIDSNGVIAYSSMDPGAVLQFAIDDVQVIGGRIILRDGDIFTYTSVIPQFHTNTMEWVSIVGYGATIKLTEQAYRAFDFDKQADFDVFGHIHLEGFTVDANQVQKSNTNHVLLGFNRDNIRESNVSVDSLIIENVRVLNVYADEEYADHAMALNLSPLCMRGATQEPYLRNIWVSGMEITGGEAGIAVTASDIGSSGPYRCFIENIYISNNSVSLGKNSGTEPPGTFYAGTGIFVGGDVRFTRDVHISDNYVQHAGDNCYEISAPLDRVTFHDNVCVNPSHVGLTLNNFKSAGDPDGDDIFGEENLSEFDLTVSNFSVRYTTYQSGTTPYHRGISLNNTGNDRSPFGKLDISNLSYVDISGDSSSSPFSAVYKWTDIYIDGMQINMTGIKYDKAAAPSTPVHILFSNTRAGGSLVLRNVYARFDGEFDAIVESNGYSVYARLFQLTGEDLDIDIENVRIDVDLRNFNDPNDKYAVFEIGHNGTQMPSGHATVSGRIVNAIVSDMTLSPDDNPHLLRFGSGLNIDNDLFFVEKIDARTLTDTSNLIFYDDLAPAEQNNLVFISNAPDGSPVLPDLIYDTDWDGVGDNTDTDDDNDGLPDNYELVRGLDPLDATDANFDLDGDTYSNIIEYLFGSELNDANLTPSIPLIGGDSDGDGIPDAADVFPLDAAEFIDTDGDGVGNHADTDDDNDATSDNLDAMPLDENETADSDGDGVGDNTDALPGDATETLDTDSDGIGNNADTDDDGDGVADISDAFPLDASESIDTDMDGIGNNSDTDDDGDGVADINDAYPLDITRNARQNDTGSGSFSWLLCVIPFLVIFGRRSCIQY